MKFLFLICAFVLCIDTYLEIQLLHKEKVETSFITDDVQQEQQESSGEQSSLSQHDKTTASFQYYLACSFSYSTHFFKAPADLIPSELIRSLYQPPEV